MFFLNAFFGIGMWKLFEIIKAKRKLLTICAPLDLILCKSLLLVVLLWLIDILWLVISFLSQHEIILAEIT